MSAASISFDDGEGELHSAFISLGHHRSCDSGGGCVMLKSVLAGMALVVGIVAFGGIATIATIAISIVVA